MLSMMNTIYMIIDLYITMFQTHLQANGNAVEDQGYGCSLLMLPCSSTSKVYCMFVFHLHVQVAVVYLVEYDNNVVLHQTK